MIFWRTWVMVILLAGWFAGTALAAVATPEGDLIGTITHYKMKKGDQLSDIARRYDIGIVELLAANPGLHPKQTPAGTNLIITRAHLLPETERQGVVINLAELRLFYFKADGSVFTAPISIGRDGWQTPTGHTRILRKREHPIWTPPASIRAEDPSLPETFPPGPANPLGDYALDLGLPGILVHGTNKPTSIGKRSSHGCIRMYPEDIRTLFGLVEVGTPVTIIDTAYKLGWRNDRLYLEVTPNQQQADVIARYERFCPVDFPEVMERLKKLSEQAIAINWYEAQKALNRQDGIPVAIGQKR